MSDDLRYPIGPFTPPDTPLDEAARRRAVETIAATPGGLRAAVQGLSDARLDTPYRPGGWTARQVVHHLPDSHLNAYLRFKLALTEERPTVRTYEEARWAELPDSAGPVGLSLDLLEHLHARWVFLLERLPGESWTLPLDHPEMGEMRVDQLLALYAWHGRHHVAHVTSLRTRRGW